MVATERGCPSRDLMVLMLYMYRFINQLNCLFKNITTICGVGGLCVFGFRDRKGYFLDGKRFSENMIWRHRIFYFGKEFLKRQKLTEKYYNYRTGKDFQRT